MSKPMIFSAAAALAVISFVGTAQAASKETEKCYGVAKAGKNDCASASGSHSCAGGATLDSDGGEWIFLPRGLCEKLDGGSLTPKKDS